MIRLGNIEPPEPAPLAVPPKAAKLTKARKAMAESNAGQSNKGEQSNAPTPPKFDKRAYQRDLMRKRRAEKKAKV
jgi:hypothetical protein